jgi:diguanylate cyclase (GGDEF)-like protein
MIEFQRWARWARSNSPVSLLVAAAAGALVLTVVAGMLVYSNTQRLILSAEWVEHTQDVLASLQRISLLVERIDNRSRLYQATGNDEQRVRALASISPLETAVVRLQNQVQDSASQRNNAQALTACAEQLGHAVEGLSLKSQLPEATTQHCQQTIGLMVDNEQWLLKDRSKGSQRSSFLSISTQIGLVVLFGLILLVLFAMLLRDALRRQELGRTMALANEQLETSVRTLEERAAETEMLTTARDELQLCVELTQVYASAAHSFGRLLEGSSGSLCMINNSRQLVETVASWSGTGGPSAVEEAFLPEACCGLRLGQPRWRLPAVSAIQCTHFPGGSVGRYLCMPIAAHGNTLGVLYVQCASDSDVSKVNNRMDGLRQLVQLTGMAIATLNLRMTLENQSIRDSLTGLFNRHFMQISLERELARAARRKLTLAVFMLDLDHFKKFNDTYGHAVGDLALRTVSEIFKSKIRTEDIACRYGGEEFTIILPDIALPIAMERAESIRRSVEALKLPVEDHVLSNFSISIGVALYPMDGEQADQLLRQADMALYRAKRQGRNCVEQYQQSLVTG